MLTSCWTWAEYSFCGYKFRCTARTHRTTCLRQNLLPCFWMSWEMMREKCRLKNSSFTIKLCKRSRTTCWTGKVRSLWLTIHIFIHIFAYQSAPEWAGDCRCMISWVCTSPRTFFSPVWRKELNFFSNPCNFLHLLKDWPRVSFTVRLSFSHSLGTLFSSCWPKTVSQPLTNFL